MSRRIRLVLTVMLFIVMIVVLAFSVQIFLPAMRQRDAKAEEVAELNRRLIEKKNENIRLAREINDLKFKPSAIERVAREKHSFCKEGEIILIYDK